jgi:hypothetical protein
MIISLAGYDEKSFELIKVAHGLLNHNTEERMKTIHIMSNISEYISKIANSSTNVGFGSSGENRAIGASFDQSLDPSGKPSLLSQSIMHSTQQLASYDVADSAVVGAATDVKLRHPNSMNTLVPGKPPAGIYNINAIPHITLYDIVKYAYSNNCVNTKGLISSMRTTGFLSDSKLFYDVMSTNYQSIEIFDPPKGNVIINYKMREYTGGEQPPLLGVEIYPQLKRSL